MNDLRAEEAQRLYWEITKLRGSATSRKRIAPLLDRMAQFHEERAKDLLSRQDADGWIDLFAAITAWGEVGSESAARSLLRFGEDIAKRDGREMLLAELGCLDGWLTVLGRAS